MIKCSIEEDSNCKLNITKDVINKRTIFNYPCKNVSICKPYKIRLLPGLYKFELWGAEGGYGRIWNEAELNEETGGRGAHVSGIAKFNTITNLYLYIGGKGEDQWAINSTVPSKGGFNGGGDGGVDLVDKGNPPESAAGGGGATDIRLIDGDALDIQSLKSRIIVAAGGGGGVSDRSKECNYTTSNQGNDLLCTNTDANTISDNRGGAGGGIHGYRTSFVTYPGNQTNGLLGAGQNGLSFNYSPGGSIGGGGGGYFGGSSITHTANTFYIAGGAGGSSYVSGYKDCRSILEFTDNNETDNEIIHYSHIVFRSITMKSGIDSFESPEGIIENGHIGSGAASITVLKLLPLYSCRQNLILSTIKLHILFSIFIL